ncbi:DUF1003 domain-containing protein [Sphingomonas sp. MMS24-J45]|uniref:DUF1003 domain-containing protein n=1 Tax=Sphingomonas sp. MMS24-J45 TaxID=3238806 RepID=UPI00384D1767
MNALRFLHDLRRGPAARDPNLVFDERSTFGERLADRVAAVGGSWGFIIAFSVFLLGWGALNTLALGARAFDPFPFIFLNLMLSMVAALQAPIIMMSQNRQSAKDRLDARLDYETNVRAEIQIEGLHAKIDALQAAIDRLSIRAA